MHRCRPAMRVAQMQLNRTMDWPKSLLKQSQLSTELHMPRNNLWNKSQWICVWIEWKCVSNNWLTTKSTDQNGSSSEFIGPWSNQHAYESRNDTFQNSTSHEYFRRISLQFRLQILRKAHKTIRKFILPFPYSHCHVCCITSSISSSVSREHTE